MRFVILAILLLHSLAAAAAAPRPPLQSWFDSGRYEQFHRAAEALAQDGDAEASYLLARAYQLGKGVKADEDVARGWYQQAVNAGSTAAVHPYGLLLMADQPLEALKLFERAAAGNLHSDAARQALATRMRLCQDYGQYRFCEAANTELLAQWGSSGDIGKLDDAIRMQIVMCAFDYRYARNSSATAQACVEAEKLAEDGAARGSPRATFNRGALAFQLGRYEEARTWYLRAFELGQPQAGFMLGQLYESGNGVDRDLDEALRWYGQAVARGDDAARKRMAKHWSERVKRSYDPAVLQAAIVALDELGSHGAPWAESARASLDLIARVQKDAQNNRKLAGLPLAPALCPAHLAADLSEWNIYAVDSVEEAGEFRDRLELVAGGRYPKSCATLNRADRDAVRNAMRRGRILVLWWPGQRRVIDAAATQGKLHLSIGESIQ